MLSWTKTKFNQYNNRTNRTHEIVKKKKKKKKNENYGKSSRLASMESERHFNVQYLIIPYVPGGYFLKSKQLQTKNFKYILQKPKKQ